MKADKAKETSIRTPARYEILEDTGAVVAESPAAESKAARRVISATEAARRFSDLINRVGYKGESYVIERGGKAMCELSPIDVHRFSGDDFLALLATLPSPDPDFLDVVEKLAHDQPTIETSPWER